METKNLLDKWTLENNMFVTDSADCCFIWKHNSAKKGTITLIPLGKNGYSVMIVLPAEINGMTRYFGHVKTVEEFQAILKNLKFDIEIKL